MTDISLSLSKLQMLKLKQKSGGDFFKLKLWYNTGVIRNYDLEGIMDI